MKKLTLCNPHIRDIGGAEDEVKLTLVASRRKRDGSLEFYEVVFEGISSYAMQCLQRKVNERMQEVRNWFAGRYEAVKEIWG